MDRSLGYQKGFHPPIYSSYYISSSPVNFDSTPTNFCPYSTSIYPFDQISNPSPNLYSIPPKPPDIYGLPPVYPEYEYSIAQHRNQIHHTPSSHQHLASQIPLTEHEFTSRMSVQGGNGSQSHLQQLCNVTKVREADFPSSTAIFPSNFFQYTQNNSAKYNSLDGPLCVQSGGQICVESEVDGFNCVSFVDDTSEVVYVSKCESNEIYTDSATEVFDIMPDREYGNDVVDGYILDDVISVNSVQQQYIEFNAELDALFDEYVDEYYDDDNSLYDGDDVMKEEFVAVGLQHVEYINCTSMQDIDNIYSDGDLVTDGDDELNVEESDCSSLLHTVDVNCMSLEKFRGGVGPSTPYEALGADIKDISISHKEVFWEKHDTHSLSDDSSLVMQAEVLKLSQLTVSFDASASFGLKCPKYGNSFIRSAECTKFVSMPAISFKGCCVDEIMQEFHVVEEKQLSATEISSIGLYHMKKMDVFFLLISEESISDVKEKISHYWSVLDEIEMKQKKSALYVANLLLLQWDPGIVSISSSVFDISAILPADHSFILWLVSGLERLLKDASVYRVFQAAILSGSLSKMAHYLLVLDGSSGGILELKWSFTIAILKFSGSEGNQQWDPGISLRDNDLIVLVILSSSITMSRIPHPTFIVSRSLGRGLLKPWDLGTDSLFNFISALSSIAFGVNNSIVIVLILLKWLHTWGQVWF